MEEFIVSARKYRPATFDTVVGQRALTTTLKNSIATGKLAHAYLFCGPRGVGKTTCARIFAKAINCLNPSADGEACNECESCRAFNEQRSMNIHELDAASNNSVEDIRELCKQVLIPPQIGRYKVFIIDEVHMLSSAAFNAFLKTLEEPPSYVVFILATTEKHKILPTILSRCQVYDFARMTVQNTVDHLAYVAQKEGYTCEPEALNLIAQKADGGMRDALSIFDQMVSFTGGQLTYERVCQNLNVLSTDYYFRLVDHFLKGEVRESMLLFNEVLQKGFDGGNFIDGLASHLRDLLVSQDASTLPLLEVSEQMRARYQEQSQRCKPRFLFQAIKLCNDCNQAYRTSRNKRLQVEICLIQAAQLTAEGDDVPGAGLSPRKILKPIFQQLAAQPKAAVRTEPARQASAAAPVAQPQPSVTTPKPVQTASANTSKLQTINIRSFSRLHRNPDAAADQKAQEASTVVKPEVELPIEEEKLYEFWRLYISQMDQSEKAMAERMRTMKLVIEDPDTVCITVNNSQVQSMMHEFDKDLTAFLQQKLQHSALKLHIRVAEIQEVRRQLSKPELLRHMNSENPAVGKLVKLLSLEFE